VSHAIDTVADMIQSQPMLSTDFADLHSETPSQGLGEGFTRRWIVDFILDAVEYKDTVDLVARRAIEPACGSGAFLLPMVERLVRSARLHGGSVEDAEDAIRAFDLNAESVALARKAVGELLVSEAVDEPAAAHLVQSWIRQGDYLLESASDGCEVDYVVGNPPYVRIEAVPRALQASYRAACPTMKGRSDIYVGFIEQGLRSLKQGGVLGFICADRWMRNSYGADLRAFIAESFSVDLVVQMHSVDAFIDEVAAYPAVFVIRRGKQSSTATAVVDARFDSSAASSLLDQRAEGSQAAIGTGYSMAVTDGWFAADHPWPDAEPHQVELLRRLEQRFSPLEDPRTETKVGIGVATGADAVFIIDDPDLVENSRLLPLAMAGDADGSSVKWGGKYLINPWNGDGLVDLAEFPKLQAYLADREDIVRNRYVARKRPNQWYRTIDRIRPELLAQPKLLIPDIRANALPMLDDGQLYPHHNLYVITSTGWELDVLGGLLLSDIADLFVRSYSVKMRGGYLRFQAQNLRRIRVPDPTRMNGRLARTLSSAFVNGDREAASEAALEAYGLSD